MQCDWTAACVPRLLVRCQSPAVESFLMLIKIKRRFRDRRLITQFYCFETERRQQSQTIRCTLAVHGWNENRKKTIDVHWIECIASRSCSRWSLLTCVSVRFISLSSTQNNKKDIYRLSSHRLLWTFGHCLWHCLSLSMWTTSLSCVHDSPSTV